MIMNKDEFLNKHWFMYHKLEGEFLKIEKTIPVVSENFETFSYSYMRLLGSICSEFNECFKNFTEFNGYNYASINQYKQFIIGKFKDDFFDSEITFNKIGSESMSLHTFEDWKEGEIFWREINNSIKHNRNEVCDGKENYKYANQINVLNALSGLFQLNMYFYKNIIENSSLEDELTFPLPQSKIFYLENWGNYKEGLVSSNLSISLGKNEIIFTSNYLD